MPTYDYHCLKCKKDFSLYISVEEHKKHPRPKCPKCKGTSVQQLFKSIAVITSKKS
jgi:putative FmdB family regulatory protein